MRHVMILLLISIALSCSGGSKEPHVSLSSGEKGTGAGEYLDPENEVVVIQGGDDDSYVFEAESLEGKLLVTEGQELDVFDEKTKDPTCEDQDMLMDVIIVDGKIVDVICYPPPESPQDEQNYVVVSEQSGDIEIPQNENNKVIVFDEKTDGERLEGDIDVDSNNVVLHGNGVDETIIEGSVTLSGNNPVIRGITITGDLILNKNNAVVLFCRIEGNLIVRKNNVTIAETEILGNLEFEEAETTNNATMVNNLVAGEWTIRGNNHLCSGNRAFNDEDQDKAFTEGELQGELSCPSSAESN